jgi:hypothetical protein
MCTEVVFTSLESLFLYLGLSVISSSLDAVFTLNLRGETPLQKTWFMEY